MAMEQRRITTERGAILREVRVFNAAKAQENSRSMPVEHHARKGIEQGNAGREVHEAPAAEVGD